MRWVRWFSSLKNKGYVMPVLLGVSLWWWFAGAGTVAVVADQVGDGIKDTGEGIDRASNGTLKIAAVAVVGYVIAKKQGWL